MRVEPQITALVLTYNEEANIGRALDSISWAEEIIVIDSGSSDRTLDIVAAYPQAKVLGRKFTTHAEQWNYALDAATSEWVLTLDADYCFPAEFEETFRGLVKRDIDGYFCSFDYWVYGESVKGAILPPRLVLFRRELGRYVDDGHTQDLEFHGVTGQLDLTIIHDDRKPLSRWLQSQIRYASLEEAKLAGSEFAALPLQDKLRKLIVIAPPLVFIYVYVIRGGFISGWRGFFYALQRFLAELLLSLFLIERKILNKSNK